MTNPHALIQLLRMEHTRAAITGPGHLLEDADGAPLAVTAPDPLADYIGPIVLTGPEWQSIARDLLAVLDDTDAGDPTETLPTATAPAATDPQWLLDLLRAEGRPITHRHAPEPITDAEGHTIGSTFPTTERVPLRVRLTADEWERVARHLLTLTATEDTNR
ncbi:hypothetical protein M3B48_009685 [Micrococcus luteus]|nr:hypothetical protein [Micrococcus luteus]MCV7633087.1 hypothetical protein [Micrococcus luteus]